MLQIRKSNFFEIINNLVYTTNTSYMEAVVNWCESNGFEIEYAADMIQKNDNLKDKIQREAECLNMVKKN